MYKRLLIFIFSIVCLGVQPLSDYYRRYELSKISEILSIDNPKDGLHLALDYYNVQHSNIVYAQAILETGHFKSRVCKEYNNLFGLYDSKNKDYYKFEHWSESVKAYVDYIQYKYNSIDNYYDFLLNIGYAEDPEYINKLKILVNQYEKTGNI